MKINQDMVNILNLDILPLLFAIAWTWSLQTSSGDTENIIQLYSQAEQESQWQINWPLWVKSTGCACDSSSD